MPPLYCNGRVFTGLSDTDVVTSFRVEDGRFEDVGDHAAEPGGVDLGGRTVVPGFIDAHTHPLLLAQTLGAVACAPPLVTSIDEMVAALRASPAARGDPDVWIEGWGYDETLLAERRTPTLHDLDRVSETQPVYVARSDCHSAVCNSVALQRAGVTDDTPDPSDGTIGRDSSGALNGVLLELGATALVRRAQPAANPAERGAHIAQLGAHFNERGIVAVTDMAAGRDDLLAFRDAVARGLRQQVVLYPEWSALSEGEPRDLHASERRGRVRIGGVKVFLDGSVSNRTAWVAEAYRDSSDHGMETSTLDAMRAAYAFARRNHVQLAVHAMGDHAIEQVIDTFADADPWLEDVPSVRIEHATLVTAGQLARMRDARMRFGVATQVIFLYAEHESYAHNIRAAEVERAYPLRDLAGTLDDVALSSDAPATTWADPDNVFVSIKAAVTRTAHDGAAFGRDQAITVAEALRLHTSRARRLAPFTNVGIIAPGFEASFVVLDRDIFRCPPEALDEVQVAETYIAGTRVFERAG